MNKQSPERENMRPFAFEKILKNCFQKNPSEGFASRITASAFALEQTQPQPFFPWLKRYVEDMMRAYHLPTPAATFAAVLMLGVTVGFGTFPLMPENDTDQLNISTILYDERGLL